jgi:hypothetical protein
MCSYIYMYICAYTSVYVYTLAQNFFWNTPLLSSDWKKYISALSTVLIIINIYTYIHISTYTSSFIYTHIHHHYLNGGKGNDSFNLTRKLSENSNSRPDSRAFDRPDSRYERPLCRVLYLLFFARLQCSGYFIVGLFCYICSFLLFVWLFFFSYALLAAVYVSHLEDRFFNTPRL